MKQWVMAPAGLIEPVPTAEFYIESIGAIEALGACVRIYLACEQMPLEVAGAPQIVSMVKVVFPIEGIPSAIGHLAQCLQPVLARGPPLVGRPRLVT